MPTMGPHSPTAPRPLRRGEGEQGLPLPLGEGWGEGWLAALHYDAGAHREARWQVVERLTWPRGGVAAQFAVGGDIHRTNADLVTDTGRAAQLHVNLPGAVLVGLEGAIERVPSASLDLGSYQQPERHTTIGLGGQTPAHRQPAPHDVPIERSIDQDAGGGHRHGRRRAGIRTRRRTFR